MNKPQEGHTLVERRGDVRTSTAKEALKRAFLDNLFYLQGKVPSTATDNDLYQALAFTIRDRTWQRWLSTSSSYSQSKARTVAYLSAEFLMGPHLMSNLQALGISEAVREAMSDLNLDLDHLARQEEEPGLGNGGLGRLAACFIDSLATLELPALGYGIRYEYGIFYQTLVDGWQVENTDKWLRHGNPWEIQRGDWAVEVRLGGHTEHYIDDHGKHRARWVPEKIVVGVPFDTPILGYRVECANTLRLWRAEASEAFDVSVFNRGDYMGAVSKKVTSESLSKVLYPNDETYQGKVLRLEQQYFFVSCSLHDMMRILKGQGLRVDQFHEKFSVQLNDTHPAIGVAELMRMLVDDYGIPWGHAWWVTTQTFCYTNHTLLPEALERWPLKLFASLLPRHLEIIYEINARFLEEVRIKFMGDESRAARLSLIDESGERYVRMAHLACVGSRQINGVADLHSELLKSDVLSDFYAVWPERFTNVTNGVTPRRWVQLANPSLTELISEAIGTQWTRDMSAIRGLEPFANDPAFREKWRQVRASNKAILGDIIKRRTGIAVVPVSMFDVLVKRIHEYKRQHLSVLHIITLYLRLKSGHYPNAAPRTFIFGGKAAPGYHMAKLIIKLISAVGDVINRDPDVGDRLKVVFLPNFSVTNGERIYPAADLSEQISTAGKEASGTGNMKFMMNGALTIGTMDGANIEIRKEAGADNFFLFGLTAPEIYAARQAGYEPRKIVAENEELRSVLELLRTGFFSKGDASLFAPIVQGLLDYDPYFLLADYADYVKCQERVSEAWQHPDEWTRMSILNTARSAYFSSDRSIREYADRIWNVSPVPISLLKKSSPSYGFLQ